MPPVVRTNCHYGACSNAPVNISDKKCHARKENYAIKQHAHLWFQMITSVEVAMAAACTDFLLRKRAQMPAR